MPSALIADNDPGVRMLLADLVRRSGFVVQVVVDGEAARDELRKGSFDLLVCDLDMPKLSGQQLLSWLAAESVALKVVVVSGYVDAKIQGDLEQHRCVRAILRKPFDIMGFVTMLRAFVRDSEAPRVPSADLTSRATALPEPSAPPADGTEPDRTMAQPG